MPIKFKNNAKAELVSGINNSATSLTVKAGQGDRFPEVSGSDFFYLTLVDSSGNREIVKCTARSAGSDSMTIVRAQEGTTARSFNANDKVELRLTAGALTQIISDIVSLFNADTTLQGNLNAHKTSDDHDGRYFTETEITTNYYSKTNLQTSGQAQVHANNLTNRSSISHSQLNNDEPAKHRQINDAATGSTDLWSAQKIDGVRANLQSQIDGKAASSHDHNTLYYTKTESNTLLAGKSDTSHVHDTRYYQKSEVDSALAGKSNVGHDHNASYYTKTESDSLLAGKSNVGHTHDDRYYTESEVNSILTGYSTTSHSHAGLNTPIIMAPYAYSDEIASANYYLLGKNRIYFPSSVNRVTFTAYAQASGMTMRLRVMIDGNMVANIDFQGTYAWRDHTAAISVAAGFHEVAFEYAYVSGGGTPGVYTTRWSVVFYSV